MFKEILKYENLMEKLYEHLQGSEFEESVKSLIQDEKERENFLSNLRELMEAEANHARICKKNMGSFKRVMGK